MPKPDLINVTYAGSACPEGGLTTTIGDYAANSSIAPFTFTMSNFRPTFQGEFGSTLRMCDVWGSLSIDPGWKVAINARGTSARGRMEAANNTVLNLRSTYQYTMDYAEQSVAMLSVDGPLSGVFSGALTPEDGAKGLMSSCGGGDIDFEFQGMAVGANARLIAMDGGDNEWTFTTDVEVAQC